MTGQSDQRAHVPIVASNRCPACVYPLDGLPGVPAEPYGPLTQAVRCPECGLAVPRGARCVVGASNVGGVDGSTWRSGTGVGLAVLGGVGVLQVGVMAWWSMRGGPLANPLILLPAMLGWVIGFVAVLRVHLRQRAQDPDGTHGGADVRLLFEPGALRVFTGGRQKEPQACAGADVQRVTAGNAWRFFPRPHQPRVMVLRVQVPMQILARSSFGGVFGYFLMPRGVQPSELAASFAATLRAKPGADALVPATVNVATPSVPPVCPRCRASLDAEPGAHGAWRTPLERAVRCGACALRVPEGAFVLSGWIGPFGGLSRRQMWVAVLSTASLLGLCAGTVILGIMWHQRNLVFFLPVVMMVPVFLWPFVMRRAMARDVVPRPAGRFQPAAATLIVEPGFVTVLVRTGGRMARSTRIPAAGISRLEFGTADPENPYGENPDALMVRGTAPELGLMGHVSVTLRLHAGVDRDELCADLNRALRRSPASAPA